MFKILEQIELTNKVNFAFVGTIISLIMIFIIAVQLSSTINSYNKTVQYLDQHKGVIENELLSRIVLNANENNQVTDEFSLLSDIAKKYYEKIGQVTGTPTFYVNDKKFVGFIEEYQNGMPEDVAYGKLLLDSNKPILFYSSPTCGYCKSAEKYMIANNIKFSKVCAPLHPGDYELCKSQKDYIY